MKVLKCDKCGVVYDKRGRLPRYRLLKKEMAKGLAGVCGSFDFDIVDLCESCQKLLNEFTRGGSK